jgi:hypothetical protein
MHFNPYYLFLNTYTVNTMQQVSSKDYSHPASQQIPYPLWNPKFQSCLKGTTLHFLKTLYKQTHQINILTQFNPENGGHTFFQNCRIPLQGCMSHLRRPQSTSSPLFDHQISRFNIITSYASLDFLCSFLFRF